jgi:outer membrane receptor for monomeric catechols
VLAGFEARRREGIGYFVTREQIQKRDPRLLSDMLRMIPGTILTAGETGRMTLRFTRSARNCPPQFYVDGIQATGFSIDDMAPGDVEGVEIFAGVTGVPPEYNRTRSTSNCGTVLIWTRIPGE